MNVCVCRLVYSYIIFVCGRLYVYIYTYIHTYIQLVCMNVCVCRPVYSYIMLVPGHLYVYIYIHTDILYIYMCTGRVPTKDDAVGCAVVASHTGVGEGPKARTITVTFDARKPGDRSDPLYLLLVDVSTRASVCVSVCVCV
jgi:hypothetical protein